MEQINVQGRTITLIHFAYEASVNNGKEWRLACMPGMTEFGETMYHKVHHHTNETRATTCPMCKKTQVFKDYETALNEALGRGPTRG